MALGLLRAQHQLVPGGLWAQRGQCLPCSRTWEERMGRAMLGQLPVTCRSAQPRHEG